MATHEGRAFQRVVQEKPVQEEKCDWVAMLWVHKQTAGMQRLLTGPEGLLRVIYGSSGHDSMIT